MANDSLVLVRRRITKLAADGHAIEAAAPRPHLMECPQQKPTLWRPEHLALSESERAKLRENLFSGAHEAIQELPASSWHRDKSEQITAVRPHSSQALALSVFWTLNSLQSRHAIARAWSQFLALPAFGEIAIKTEEVLPKSLLGELRSTQVDAVILGSSASALVECKFTESDGGACSQTVQRKRKDGRRVAQCNGKYEEQRNELLGSTGRCALTEKGIRYWKYIPEVLGFDAGTDHAPCPFVGGWFQWMRNMVAARAMERRDGVPHSFIVAYADGPFPMARKIASQDWQRFLESSTGAVQIRTISFQKLIDIGLQSVVGGDSVVLENLAAWVGLKVRSVAP